MNIPRRSLFQSSSAVFAYSSNIQQTAYKIIKLYTILKNGIAKSDYMLGQVTQNLIEIVNHRANLGIHAKVKKVLQCREQESKYRCMHLSKLR